MGGRHRAPISSGFSFSSPQESCYRPCGLTQARLNKAEELGDCRRRRQLGRGGRQRDSPDLISHSHPELQLF